MPPLYRAPSVPISPAVRAAMSAHAYLAIPQKGRLLVEHNMGTVGADNPGTSVTTGAAADTKGTAVELVAATAFDVFWVTVIARGYGTSAAASQGCLDLLIGAATEEVLIPNMLMGHCGGRNGLNSCLGWKVWDFPLYIGAGSRLAAQAAGARVNTAFQVGLYLYGGVGSPNFRVGSKVTTYGVSAVPNGTTVTPGASGAEGAWAEMTASTSEDHFALVPSFQPTGDSTLNFLTFAVDLGLGAATEEEIAQSYWFRTDTAETMDGPMPSIPHFQDIPSGSRLTMRASNSGVNDGGYNGAIHAVS